MKLYSEQFSIEVFSTDFMKSKFKENTFMNRKVSSLQEHFWTISFLAKKILCADRLELLILPPPPIKYCVEEYFSRMSFFHIY